MPAGRAGWAAVPQEETPVLTLSVVVDTSTCLSDAAGLCHHPQQSASASRLYYGPGCVPASVCVVASHTTNLPSPLVLLGGRMAVMEAKAPVGEEEEEEEEVAAEAPMPSSSSSSV